MASTPHEVVNSILEDEKAMSRLRLEAQRIQWLRQGPRCAEDGRRVSGERPCVRTETEHGRGGLVYIQRLRNLSGGITALQTGLPLHVSACLRTVEYRRRKHGGLRPWGHCLRTA